MIALIYLADLALVALLITLRIGLWVCLAYAWQPWAVSRPKSRTGET